jgi:hypothetical protein
MHLVVHLCCRLWLRRCDCQDLLHWLLQCHVHSLPARLRHPKVRNLLTAHTAEHRLLLQLMRPQHAGLAAQDVITRCW